MKLEKSPEFQKALTEACENQYGEFLYGGRKFKSMSKESIEAFMKEMNETKDAMRERAGKARLSISEAGREITANLRRKQGLQILVCPVCGEGDKGNRVNGKSHCFMNAQHKMKGVSGPVLLLTPEKAEKWKSPEKSKTNDFTFKEVDGVVRWRK